MKPTGAPSPRGAVPVPPVDPRTGNQFPEPSGTGGTGCPLFEPLAAFLERTRDLPPLSWLIEGVVPDSGNLLIVAAPGAGKTFLALVIAKTAAAEGRSSLLVLEEGRPRCMFDRFTALAFPPDAPVFIAHRKGVRLEDEAIRAKMAEFLRTHEAPVVVFDPFSSLFLGVTAQRRWGRAARNRTDWMMERGPGSWCAPSPSRFGSAPDGRSRRSQGGRS